jgi:hypothetical protein
VAEPKYFHPRALAAVLSLVVDVPEGRAVLAVPVPVVVPAPVVD